MTLKKAVWATRMNQATGQDLAEEKLPAGTEYTFVSRQEDANGWWWLTIDVGGCSYEVHCPYAHLYSPACTHTTAEYEG